LACLELLLGLLGTDLGITLWAGQQILWTAL
jgi:hypothetical protein